MKRIALAVVGAAMIAGCQSSTGGAIKTDSPATTTPATSAVDQPSSQVPTSTTAASSPTPALPTEFGPNQGFVWTDGLKVSVLSAKKFTPSAQAAGTVAGGTAVALQIRITNGTKTAFDPSLVQVAVHAGPNGDQGSSIVDFDGPVALSDFQGSIPVGQAATATLGFDVPTADLPNLTVIITPDFDHNDATLTGAVS